MEWGRYLTQGAVREVGLVDLIEELRIELKDVGSLVSVTRNPGLQNITLFSSIRPELKRDILDAAKNSIDDGNDFEF